MYLELAWPEALRVCRAELIQTSGNQFTPAALDVSVWRGNQWEKVLSDSAPGWDKFVFRQGHPVYGIEPRTLEWPAAPATRLRLAISRAHAGHPWAIDAIRVFHTPARPAQ